MSEKLAPCPFCGGNRLVICKDHSEDDPSNWYAMHVFCTECHARGRNNYPIGWCESERAASDAWNDRNGNVDDLIDAATQHDIVKAFHALKPLVEQGNAILSRLEARSDRRKA
jgi:Lar family restriction alleviation protein